MTDEESDTQEGIRGTYNLIGFTVWSPEKIRIRVREPRECTRKPKFMVRLLGV